MLIVDSYRRTVMLSLIDMMYKFEIFQFIDLCEIQIDPLNGAVSDQLAEVK